MFRKVILGLALAGAMSLPAFAACGVNSPKGAACGDKGAACGVEKNSKCNTMQRKNSCGTPMGMNGGCCSAASSLATVKLSAEQKAKIEAIDEEFRIEMAKLHIKDKSMKDPFVNQNGFNKEAFKKDRSEKMQKHLDLKAEQFAKTWEVLTPEQQKSITALSK